MHGLATKLSRTDTLKEPHKRLAELTGIPAPSSTLRGHAMTERTPIPDDLMKVDCYLTSNTFDVLRTSLSGNIGRWMTHRVFTL